MTTLRANRATAGIPTIGGDLQSHTRALEAIRDAIHVHERRTRDVNNSFVRVQDLVDMGLVNLVNGNFNNIGVSLDEIADLGDLSGASEGDFLRFISGEWRNADLETADITEIMVTQHEAALEILAAQITDLESITPVWTGAHRWVDNAQVQLGTGGDLAVYHDGTDSFIESDTGKLVFSGSGSSIEVRQRLDLNPDPQTPPANSIDSDAQLVLINNAAVSIQQLCIGTSLSLGYRFVSGGGTFSVPTAVNTTDINYMSFLGAGGYDGTNWQTGAAGLIGIRPGDTWSGTSRPTYVTIEATAVGSTNRAEIMRVMRISATPIVGIGRVPLSSAGGNGINLQIGSTSLSGTGVTIFATTTSDIQFADGDTGNDRFRGMIRYSHASDFLSLWTNAAEKVRIVTTGETLISDGAGVTTPGLAFLLDADTGVRRVGTNNIAIVAGGADIISVLTDTANFSQRIDIRNSTPDYRLTETDQSTDEQIWRQRVAAKVFTIETVNGAITDTHNLLSATRGTGIALTDVTLGNNNDFPTLTMQGQIRVGNAVAALVTNIANPAIYAASGTGAGDFANAGALFIQPRSSAARDIIILTGSTTPVERMRIGSGGTVSISAAAGVETARFDANATAGNTRFMIYDVDNATLERVSVGAADSGGAGFKVLRIPN